MAIEMKPLLIGELNPYGSDPRYALYFEPRHSAGGRLCHLILQMTGREYIRTFDRANLCVGRWSLPAAREEARRLMDQRSSGDFFLMGAKVSSAFGLSFRPFTTLLLPTGQAVHTLPHPSGRNLLWNDPQNVIRARRMFGATTALDEPEPQERLPSTDTGVARPARCSNCGITVTEEWCPDCGPP